ncbi:MAG: YHS domain-containing protein [Nitrospirota bacterium]
MKTDPVCGMDVKEDTQYNTLHGGKKMYFCSRECQQKFIHNPEGFESGKESSESKSQQKGGKRAA